jgi:phosphomannomutase
VARVEPSVFKSYDIRGTYPEQLDEAFAWRLGRALAACLPGGPVRSVVLGRDPRLSSPALYAALAAGFAADGVEAAGLGLCPTELVYHVAGRDGGPDLGVMVTASHNPPGYNGFKVVRSGGAPVSGAEGLYAAREAMEAMEAPPEAAPAAEPTPLEGALDEYADFALGLVGAPQAGGLRVAVDAGNGVAGLLWDALGRRLGLEPVGLNMEPDGRFPAHHPDPTRRENVEPLVRAVREQEADLGFCYDGDADRVVAVLASGHVVDGSEMIACIVERLLRRDPHAAFGVAQTTSRKALDRFRALGAEPLMTPVGHAKIKRIMRARPELAFCGEDAGHYYFRDFHCCDSSLITTLHLLHLAADDELEGLVAGLPGPWHRPAREPAFRFDEQGRALAACRRVARAALEAHGRPQEITCERAGEVLRGCAPADVDQCEGTRADYEDWWFCVRPSGTEPLARLALEARSEEMLAERTAALSALFEESTER